MDYNILTLKEREQLALVATTKEQAQRIKDRNTGLLNTLHKMYNGGSPDEGEVRTEVGCPHCNDTIYSCRNCAWQAVRPPQGRADGSWCIYQTFGNVCYRDVCDDDRCLTIGYADSWEEITCYYDGAGDLNDQYHQCEKLLLGHIEWANALLTGDMECHVPTPPA